jgi:hypothetical protein
VEREVPDFDFDSAASFLGNADEAWFGGGGVGEFVEFVVW